DGRIVSEAREAQTSLKSERIKHNAEQGVRAPSEDRALQVGDRVRLISFGSVGVVDRIKDGEAEVRVGSLRLREKLSNLELIDETSYRTASGSQRGSSPTVREGSLEKMRPRAATELHLYSRGTDSKFKTANELNLIGKTTDEAVELADKFLDQAFLN